MDKILIIDGLNFIFRATITFGSNISENQTEDQRQQQLDKEKYNIVYNFFRNLKPIVEKFEPNKIFFVLEGHPAFRYALYPEYKANRIIKYASKSEYEQNKFKENKDLIIKLLKYLPVTIVKSENYECDDTIATLVENLKDEDITVITNDSDFVQLLQKGYKNLKIYNSIKKEFMLDNGIHCILFKSLAGDKSDNISGLVSKAKAEKLCKDIDALNKFMEIEENRAKLALNKELIEFKNVPCEEIVFTNGLADYSMLEASFKSLGFNSMFDNSGNYWNKFVDVFKKVKLSTI